MRPWIQKGVRHFVRERVLRVLRAVLPPGSHLLRDLLFEQDGSRLISAFTEEDAGHRLDTFLAAIDDDVLLPALRDYLLENRDGELTEPDDDPSNPIHAMRLRHLLELFSNQDIEPIISMYLQVTPEIRLRDLLESLSLDDVAPVIRDFFFGNDGVQFGRLIAAGSPIRISNALRTKLFVDDAQLFRGILRQGEIEQVIPALEEYLLSNHGKRMTVLLQGLDETLLSPVLLEFLLRERGRRLAELLAGADPARAAVALREFLLHDDGGRLLALLHASDFRNLGPVLHAFLCDDGAKRLGTVLQMSTSAELSAALAKDHHKAFREALLAEDSNPFREVLLADNAKVLRTAFFVNGLMALLLDQPNTAGWVNFDQEWKALLPWIDGVPEEVHARALQRRTATRSVADVPTRIAEALVRDGILYFGPHQLRLSDSHAVWTLLHELFVNEDYFAELEGESPRILDCGAHQGVSIHYFKRRFPHARITAFEPDPGNRAIAEENIARNGLTDVEVLPYAIAANAGTAQFHVPKGFSMAGSLTERRKVLGNETECIEVECVPLSRYLGERIDFLKLDIEGSECEVLEESAALLRQVQYLFCEYHHGLGLEPNRLTRIMRVLDEAGFDTQIAKSYSYRARSEHRPLSHLGEPYSGLVFARRRDT